MITALVSGTALFLWLAVAAFLLLTQGDAGLAGPLRVATALGLAGVILCTTVWLWEQTRKGRDFFHPALAFPAAYLIWFALGSIDLVDPVPDTRMWDRTPPAILAMAALGLLAYALGVRTVGTVRSADHAERIRRVMRSWEADRVRLVGCGLLAVALTSYAALVAAVGIPVLADNPAAARLGIAQQAELFAIFYSAVLAFVPMSLAYLWSALADGRAERWFILVANGAVFMMVLALGNRGLVLQPALLALLVAHYVRGRLPLRALLVAGVAGVVFLSVIGIWRDVTTYGVGHLGKLVSWGFPIWSLPFTYIYTYVRDPIATFREITEMIPRFVEYQYGQILASPLVTALPGYQESSDLFFKRILRNEFVGAGRPATLLGSLYADLGLAGIVAGLVIFGALSQWLYRRFSEQPTPVRLLLHVWVAQTALLSLFSSLFPYPTTVFVPFLMWVLCLVLIRGSTPQEGLALPAPGHA